MDLSERRENYTKNEKMAEDIVNGMTGEDDEGETCNNNKSRGKDEKIKRSGKNNQETIVSSSFMIIMIIITT